MVSLQGCGVPGTRVIGLPVRDGPHMTRNMLHGGSLCVHAKLNLREGDNVMLHLEMYKHRV